MGKMLSLKQIRDSARRDDGVALVVVLGITMVVTALAVGSYLLATESLHSSHRAEDKTRAFRAAATGLDESLATFTTPEGYPAAGRSGSTPDGTYHVALDTEAGDGEFKLIADGVGLDHSTERLVQRFYYFNLWKMNFAGTGPQSLITGTSGLNGSSQVLGPFYMKGNLQVDSNMSVREGPLFVKGGNVAVTGSGQIGESTAPIRLYADGSLTGPSSQIFIKSRSVSVPDIVLPKLTYQQMTAWATLSQNESFDNRMGAVPEAPAPDTRLANRETSSQPGAYKFFGDAANIAPMNSGLYPLQLGGATFGSWGNINTTGTVLPSSKSLFPLRTNDPYTAADTNRYDDFAYWSGYSAEFDILFINGTVFVDGPVTFNRSILYVGNGTIVSNGDITVKGKMRPFGADNLVGEQNRWALGLVTPGNMTVTAASSNTASNVPADILRATLPDMAGAFYVDKIAAYTGNNLIVRGSILAGRMEMGQNNIKLVTNPLLPEYLPASMPGAKVGIVFPGDWSRE